MKVSLNWIRFINEKYRCAADPAPHGVDKLVEKIGAQLGAVEEVVDLGKKYQGILVVKVVSCVKHPNADKLSVCMVDAGKGKPVQVVCGAPNVKTGMLAAWIPPGIAGPSTIDKDPFVIEAREIRGVVSNGMLASAKELALGDDHTGIVSIDEEAKPGTPISKVYRLDDYIIDIENKMFTHRPDLFGQLGVARELAGIQHQVFKSPSWYRMDAPVPASNARDDHKLTHKNQLPKLVPRFCLLVMKDVQVKPSPLWLDTYLSRVGVRPINNIVDLTNFFMLETAQPLHAYDYDKVMAQDPDAKHATINVRPGKKGEKLKLLGGKTIELNPDVIVIASATKVIGLGGVMGGADTEVDENTKTIILEVGTFDMNTTRRTAMYYGLFTDAATRFTKGQSPLQNQAVIAKTVEDIQRLAGGRISGKLIESNHVSPEVMKRGSVHPPVKVSRDFINQRLGLQLSTARIADLLKNVEFEVKTAGDQLDVKAPFWRTDIEIPEDVVEEVGRLYGYDHLPVVLPLRNLTPAPKDSQLELKARLRDILAKAGANEVLTYSFVHADLLKKTDQDPAKAFKLANALSPDLQYYRLSLTPSLLDKVHSNIKNGFDEFCLFELNKVHNQLHEEENEPGLPKEYDLLALTFASRTRSPGQHGSAVYQARSLLDFLASQLGLTFEYMPLKHEPKYPSAEPFDHTRSALVSEAKTGTMLGMVGEFKPKVVANFKLPAYSAGFEVDLNRLLSVAGGPSYTPLNRYPSVEQDFCLRSSVDLPYTELTTFMESRLKKSAKDHGYIYTLMPLDIFQRPNDTKYKQTTWRITLAHLDRTLTTEKTNKLLDRVAKEAKVRLKADRI